MTNAIRQVWGDGEHVFLLARIGLLRELQDKCKAGPAAVLRRLGGGDWMVDDIREVIRLGLIGGGMTPTEAHVLTQRYCDERPLLESVAIAQAVLLAALVGDPDDPLGKPIAEKAQTGPTDGSPSPPSTAGAP